jgi:N-acetylmuramic acid 6-phosphate etherase
MVDLMATNAKLQDRAERIVAEVAALSRDEARALLATAGGRVKRALVMQAMGGSADAAQAALDEAGGVVRRVLPPPPPVA